MPGLAPERGNTMPGLQPCCCFGFLPWNNYKFIGSCKYGTEKAYVSFTQFSPVRAFGVKLQCNIKTRKLTLIQSHSVCMYYSFCVCVCAVLHITITCIDLPRLRYGAFPSPQRSRFCIPFVVVPTPHSWATAKPLSTSDLVFERLTC